VNKTGEESEFLSDGCRGAKLRREEVSALRVVCLHETVSCPNPANSVRLNKGIRRRSFPHQSQTAPLVGDPSNTASPSAPTEIKETSCPNPNNSTRPSTSIFLVISFFFVFFTAGNRGKKRFGDPDRSKKQVPGGFSHRT